MKPDPVLARLAAMKAAPVAELKKQWRELFSEDPPAFNRRYLESRLAYRIQELAYGGLKPETVRRLERLGEELDGGDKKKNLYDCEAALDSYLSATGAPGTRIASRTIPYPAYDYGYGYPQGYSYGYTYAPPPQMVMVPVRTEVPQQVVVRETERYETYTVPGASRVIPEPRPSAKMIKTRRR